MSFRRDDDERSDRRRRSEDNRKGRGKKGDEGDGDGFDHPLDAFRPENNSRRKRKDDDGGGDDGPDDEEIKHRWRNKEDLVSILSEGERRERREKYGTKTRSESVMDLRAAASTPPSRRRRDLSGVAEEREEEGERDKRGGERRGRREEEEDAKKDDNKYGGELSFRKASMVQLGLARQQSKKDRRLFDDEEGLGDDEAPGAFKRPASAYKLAKRDLKSEQWQTEVDGLDALVRLVRYHPDLILDDLKYVVGAVLHECKNLRSQVTRAAVQTFGLMFEHLGRQMEELKAMEDVASMLFTKTADTNRFIRRDSLSALDAMADHLGVARVVSLAAAVGAAHKNTVARTVTARMLAAAAERLGAERLFRRRERGTLDTMLAAGVSL